MISLGDFYCFQLSCCHCMKVNLVRMLHQSHAKCCCTQFAFIQILPSRHTTGFLCMADLQDMVSNMTQSQIIKIVIQFQFTLFFTDSILSPWKNGIVLSFAGLQLDMVPPVRQSQIIQNCIPFHFALVFRLYSDRILFLFKRKMASTFHSLLCRLTWCPR